MAPAKIHPSQALFSGEKSFPVLPGCEHFAGSERLILKTLDLQQKLGPVFDLTCDCEDGAPAGQETAHAEMIVRILNSAANRYKMAGARIHDFSHPHWKRDIEILIGGAGNVLAYLTIPKCTSFAEAETMITAIQQTAKANNLKREIPVHILIETHGALQDVQRIATLPSLQVLDFGLMDFVSAHHGAIPASAMRSPGQFDHRLIARAKTEIVAAALANGLIPSHNVSLDLRNGYNVFRDAWRARNEFGFLRMWSIHPSQITAIVDAMKPDHSEAETAAKILLAAQATDWGPISYDGELHDRATYRYYWQLLQKAKNTGVKIPEAAMQAFFHA